MTLSLRRAEGSYVPPVLPPGNPTSLGSQFAATALYNLHFAPAEGSTMSALIDRPKHQRVTEPSVIPIHGHHDRVKARFRMLRRLPKNHDREGAAAPNSKSIDRAIAFVDCIARGPAFNATLDDDGSAVIEFEDRATGFFADITFRADGHVELYSREPGRESEFFEGPLDAPEAREFLESKMGLVV